MALQTVLLRNTQNCIDYSTTSKVLRNVQTYLDSTAYRLQHYKQHYYATRYLRTVLQTDLQRIVQTYVDCSTKDSLTRQRVDLRRLKLQKTVLHNMRTCVDYNSTKSITMQSVDLCRLSTQDSITTQPHTYVEYHRQFYYVACRPVQTIALKRALLRGLILRFEMNGLRFSGLCFALLLGREHVLACDGMCTLLQTGQKCMYILSQL